MIYLVHFHHALGNLFVNQSYPHAFVNVFIQTRNYLQFSFDFSSESPKMKKSNILNNIFTYCDRATIGVLKYISRRSLTKFERIFWILCIAVTLVGSVFLIKEAVSNFLARKITIKISDERIGVGEIPFASLSICPEVEMSEKEFSRIYSKIGKNG